MTTCVTAASAIKDALRRLANRLTGILRRCLETRTLYDETSAWSYREKSLAA